MSSRWLKRVASSIFLLGLVVAIVILLLPGEYERKRIQKILNKTFNNTMNSEPQRLNVSVTGKGILNNTAPL